MNIYHTLFVVALASFPGCKDSSGPEPEAAAPETPGPKDTKDVAFAGMNASDIPAPPDVKAAPADAKKSDSGLAWKVLSPGNGAEKPNPWDTVEVHYTGWTTDGKMFDSSIKRNRTARFGVENVIKGWTEGLQLMVEGEKRRFWIPGNLAYGDTPKRPGAPAGTLVFDVELVKIHKGKPPVPAPEDVAAIPADAKKTASGLAYKILTPAKGNKKPNAWDRVEVHYTGWTTDGKMFDSSVQRGQPAGFQLNRVIKGWTEGVQLMVEGEKRRFWIPADLAYGEPASRPGAPAGMLVFEIELLKVTSLPKPPDPPKLPEDVAAAPKDAKKTASGLAYKVLKKGAGKTKPKASDRVEVHYSGWTTDGNMFDSSVTRGKPGTFPVGGVIKGWIEGLQLMVEGEKTRFWIPAELAYGNSPAGGRPAGMLVFDVELLKINPPAAGHGAHDGHGH